MKCRMGFVYQDTKTGNWYARVCYTQDNGKRASIKRRVENKTHGNKVLKELMQIVESGGRKAIDAEKMTFNDGLSRTFGVSRNTVTSWLKKRDDPA